MKFRVQAEAQWAPTNYDCVLHGVCPEGRVNCVCGWQHVMALQIHGCSMIHRTELDLVSAAIFRE